MKEVEARLKISAVDRTGKVLGKIGNQLREVNRKAIIFNNQQKKFADSTAAAYAAIARFAAPAALAYGLKESVTQFADAERRMNRIGITADASKEEIADATQQLKFFAQEVGLSFDGAVEGLDVLTSSGQNLREAMAFLPSILKTAQASGASVTDVANTAIKTASALKLQAFQMEKAFDVMVAGGKAGQFELKDMAQYIPEIANSFAALGYEGESGLKQLIAVLQTLREDTGSASAAATQAQNIFGKMMSEETANRFKKFGIDLRKEMQAAKASGEDALTAFVRLSKQALNGDLSKLPLLFADQEFRLGMQSLITSPEALEKFISILNGADVKGTVLKDLNRILGDTQTKIDRLGNSWDNMVKRVGATASDYLSPAMDTVTKFLDDKEAYDAGMGRLKQVGPELYANSRDEFFKGIADAKLSTNVRTALDQWNRYVQSVGRGETTSISGWIRRESLRTDSQGILRENYSKYRMGMGPQNPLGARDRTGDLPEEPDKGAGWNGKAPVPEARPRRAVLEADRLREAYNQAQGFGREYATKVSRQYQDEADLNRFYGTDTTPDQAIAHYERMKKRFPERYKSVTNPEALGKSRVVPNSEEASGGQIDKQLPDMSGITRDLEDGSRKLSDSGDEAGRRLVEATQEAARILTAAAAAASATLSNIKVQAVAAVSAPARVNADTGRTNTFVNSPTRLGHQ